MKSYYQVYQKIHNNYPIADAVMLYVDASMVQNEKEAVELAYQFVKSAKISGYDTVSLGVAQNVKEELLSTKDGIVYYIDHYKVDKYLNSLKSK